MKKLLILGFIMGMTVTAMAQQPPTQVSNPYVFLKWIKVIDSIRAGIYFQSPNDTLSTKAYARSLAGGLIDTANLSKRINLKQDTVYRINDSTLGYSIGGRVHTIIIRGAAATPTDTTHLSARIDAKVEAVFRVNDSTIGVTINGVTTQFLIRGNGGGGGGGGGYTPPGDASKFLVGDGTAISAAAAQALLGLGTAAFFNVPASGNAASGEIVKGNDTRLTDSRAPTGAAGGTVLNGTYPNPGVQTNSITNGMLRQSSALTIIGNSINSTSTVTDIAASTDKDVLRRNGTSLGFGHLDSSYVTGVHTENYFNTKYALIGAVGGSQNLQGVLKTGNLSTIGMIFDSVRAKPGQNVGVTANYITINPVDTSEQAPPFFIGTSSTGGVAGGGQPAHSNNVLYLGWNINNSGGQYKAHWPSIGMGFESWWRPDSTISFVESHWTYIDTSGVSHRLQSWTIDNTNAGISLYHTADTWDFRNHGRNSPYFAGFGVDNSTTIDWINSKFQNQYFDFTSNFRVDTVTAAFIISANTPRPNNTFQLAGFTELRTPSFITANGGAQQISSLLLSGNGTDLFLLRADSTESTLTTMTNTPIKIQPHNVTTASFFLDHEYFSQSLNLGDGDQSNSHWLDIRNTDRSITFYLQDSKPGGIAQYITNSNGGSYGLYVGAYGGGSKAIYVNPAGTANDASLYSDGQSRMYHAGRVGIGGNFGTTPSWMLHLDGTFGITKDSLPFLSSRGFSQILVQDSSTGQVKRIDVQNLGTGITNAGIPYALGYYVDSTATIQPLPVMTGNRAVITDVNGLPFSSGVTNVELGYVSGVTSGIQTQLDASEKIANKGVANGYAGLNALGTVHSAQLPLLVRGPLTKSNDSTIVYTGTDGVTNSLVINGSANGLGIRINNPGGTDVITYFSSTDSSLNIRGIKDTLFLKHFIYNDSSFGWGLDTSLVALHNFIAHYASGSAIGDAAADGTTKGISTYTAADFNASSGVISLDYTNGQAASTSTKGFLTSTDWNTFNGKVSGSLTSGRVALSSGSASLSDNSNFTYNGTTLGIVGTGNEIMKISGPSSGAHGLHLKATDVAGYTNIFLDDENGSDFTTQYGGLAMYNSSVSGSLLGHTKAGWLYLLADGTALNGISIGTLTSDPVTVATNGTERYRVDGSGNQTFTLGSDATGDMFYRNSSGFLTRLPIGTSAQHLVISSGLPVWRDTMAVAAASSGSYTPTLTGTTNITGTPSLSQATYLKIDNTVIVTVSGLLVPTSVPALVVLTISLPFSTTNTTQNGIGGGSLITGSTVNSVPGRASLVSGTTVQVSYTSDANAGSNQAFTTTFTYKLN